MPICSRTLIVGLITLIALVLGACATNPAAPITPLGGGPTTYDEVLPLAIEEDNPDLCGLITVGRSYGDYAISVEESIDVCKAEFAIKTKNLEYCLTLKEKSDQSPETRSQRDICLEGLARELKHLDLCDSLQLGEIYKHACKIRAVYQRQDCEVLCDDVGCKDNCYTILANNVKDPQMCNQVSTEPGRDSCYLFLAIESNDPEICNYFDDSSSRAFCIEEVNNPPDILDGP
jgi:hypothetical protein